MILVLLAFNDSKNSYDHQEQVLFSGPFPVLFTDRPESVGPGPIGFGPWILELRDGSTVQSVKVYRSLILEAKNYSRQSAEYRLTLSLNIMQRIQTQMHG